MHENELDNMTGDMDEVSGHHSPCAQGTAEAVASVSDVEAKDDEEGPTDTIDNGWVDVDVRVPERVGEWVVPGRTIGEVERHPRDDSRPYQLKNEQRIGHGRRHGLVHRVIHPLRWAWPERPASHCVGQELGSSQQRWLRILPSWAVLGILIDWQDQRTRGHGVRRALSMKSVDWNGCEEYCRWGYALGEEELWDVKKVPTWTHSISLTGWGEEGGELRTWGGRGMIKSASHDEIKLNRVPLCISRFCMKWIHNVPRFSSREEILLPGPFYCHYDSMLRW